MEEWLENMMELAEIGKLTALIKEKKHTSNFVSTWKPLLTFRLKTEIGTLTLGFTN